MHRLVLALVALTCIALVAPVQAQQARRNSAKTTTSRQTSTVERPGARPAVPILSAPRPTRVLLAEQDDLGQPGDSLSESQVLLRLSRIYTYQAQSLAAQANQDVELAEDLLELAMTEMSTLLQQPEIMERPRFLELYRTVLGEYERYYGVSADTLTTQFGEIFQFRADIFAALNDVDEPLLEDVMLPEIGPVETVFPMTMNRLVEQSIAFLLRSSERHLYHWISRSETYFPMIEQILREEGVPDELKYLAMIESGLNPRAKSWAQAGGMWQFITATGSAYGLRTNSWVDERQDPEKATRAAARHLKDLYELFDGDWQLALAGYNCSPSRIKRAIARAEQRTGRRATFWDIYNDIPKETRNYVPMFIAAALVASNPTAFDVDLDRIKPGPKYTYHYVPVHGLMPVDMIADLAGTDEATIRALNPELRRSSTPPGQQPYYVRIPHGSFDRFAAAYGALPRETRVASAAVDYTVRRGDTLSKIAKQYGVSVSALMRSNELRSTSLRVGQRLTVPVEGGSETRQVTLIDLATIESFTIEYGDRSVRPITADGAPRLASSSRPSSTASRTPVVRVSAPAEQPEAPAEETQAEEPEAREEDNTSETRIVYRVRRGDNLTEIAKKYGVGVDDLRRWNNLRSSQLAVGQRLYLYETKTTVRETAAPAASRPATNKVVYRVRRGDTLSEIASRHGVSIADLRSWNSLSSNRIRSGQRLTIHTDGSAPQADAKPKTIVYRVRRGDNLTEIAKRHGVSVEDIKSWNGLRSSVIRPGQKLTIRS